MDPLLPWPSARTFNAAAGGTGQTLPWVPPPPIYGLPQGSPPNNADPFYAHYYHTAPLRDYPTAGGAGGLHTSCAADSQPASTWSRSGWPVPDDLPLPSAFPMPPALLPTYPATHPLAWQHVPPAPNSWSAPWPPLASPPPITSEAIPSQMYSSAPSEDAAEVASCDSECSECSCCSTCERAMAAAAAAASQQRHRQSSPPQKGKRFHTAPQPARSPREREVSPVPEATRSQANIGEQARRPLLPRRQAPPVRPVTTTPVYRAVSARRTTSAGATDLVDSQQERMSVAVAGAEDMLKKIEALYLQLRDGYESLQRSPERLFTDVETASATTASTTLPSSVSVPTSHGSAGVRRVGSIPSRQMQHAFMMNSPAPRAPPAAPTEGPMSMTHETPISPAALRAERQPQQPAAQPAPQDRHSGSAAARTRTGVEVVSAASTTRPLAVVPGELHQELRKLESQWKRLEELRKHSSSTAGGAAAPSSISTDQSLTDHHGVSSSSAGTAVMGGYAADTHSATYASSSAASGISEDQVLRLVRERRAVAAAGAGAL